MGAGPMASTPINEQGKILTQCLKRWKFISAHLHLSPTTATSTCESDAHGNNWSHFLPISCTPISLIPPCHLGGTIKLCDHHHITCQMSINLPSSSPPPRPNWRRLTTHDLKRSYTSPLEAIISLSQSKSLKTKYTEMQCWKRFMQWVILEYIILASHKMFYKHCAWHMLWTSTRTFVATKQFIYITAKARLISIELL